MMKKYIKLILIFLLAGFVSCNEDVLDIPQRGVLEVERTYLDADDETVTSFMAAIHYKIHGDSYTDGYSRTSVSALSLRSHLGTMGGEFAEYFQYLGTAENSVYTLTWSYYYTIIYWCNMVIEQLPNNQVASEEVINLAIAEARAIRSIMMMNLVQLYGNPPLADHIMTGEEGNTTANESWSFVESELAAVAEQLPSKSGIDGQRAIGSRLTKEAVYAYLGKAYLWQKKYSEAAQILYNKVIATNLYALVNDFSELNRYTSDFCPEYLWEYDITDASGYEISQAGLFDAVNYNWAPNSLFIPEGLYNEGGFSKTAYASDAFGVFMDEHETNGNTKSNRYRASIASYDELLDETLYSYSAGEKGMQSGGATNCEGYFRIKLLPRAENVMGPDGWIYDFLHNNLCYMRYAEVLLNYAEAVAMGGNEGAITGLDALNMVRSRAGLPEAPSLSMDNEEYGVKAERRAELFFEGSRFIDLVRWGDAVNVLADCGKYKPDFYGYQNGNNSAPQGKDQWKIIKTATIGEGFKANKHELFPIPAVDLNNNPSLVQNPGW
ncbi:RagB/SusD family nutrient uptake outer membrane protein [uncultured Draconibacterium sp.]|uniref:RagB/SusD family nutrient uptake outer membrane protein n=1 Tax=uncultured Draconibacterium sp. TaxID=1573823 RepID=UPI0032168D06